MGAGRLLHRGARRPALVLWASAAVLALVGAFTAQITTGVFGAGHRVFWNSWVYQAAVLGVLCLCAWRALSIEEGRRGWSIMSIGLGLYWVAGVYYALWLSQAENAPYPSPSDGLYFCAYAMFCWSILALTSVRGDRPRWTTLLEALAGALATGALGAAIILAPGVTSLEGPTAAMLTSLTYPALDVLLLALVAGGLLAHGPRPPLPLWLMLAALLVLVVTDSVFLLETASDAGYTEGSLVDIGWPIAFMAIAVAAWSPTRPAPAPRGGPWREQAVSAGFCAIIVLLVVWEAITPIAPVARWLLAAGLVVTVAQLVRGTVERQRIADQRERTREQLHDDALQYVFAARQDLELARAGDPDGLGYAQRALHALTVELRRVMAELAPPSVEAAEVEQALRDATADAARRGGLKIKIDAPRSAVGPHADLVFSLAREFVINAAKHADASKVEVHALRIDRGTQVLVTDDGRGLSEEQRREAEQSGHLGLLSARRRVEATGGRLHFTTTPGGGTTISATLPDGR